MTRKSEKNRIGLNSQIKAAINTAIRKKVIPALQGKISALESGLIAKSDLQTVGLHRSPEGIGTNENTSQEPYYHRN